MKKIAVIGSGAREHALVRALIRGAAQSADREPREVIAIPGNPGIAREARCIASGSTVQQLAEATVRERPDLAVVGPEAPLAAGLADLLAEAGIACFGPSAAAAQIEASKSFAKEVMRAAGVPTAASESFDDHARARAYAASRGACVVKLDGLAAGKGVIVCSSSDEAARAVDELWQLGALQGAALKLVIEEKLSGNEISVIAFSDGERLLLLPPARDHKRLYDFDRGPNTGGMGAVSPPRQATEALLDEVLQTVLRPTVHELKRRGTPFRGALFAGLMLTPAGVRVLEFNCRLGDPEAQAILMRVTSDVLPLFEACAAGSLAGLSLAIDPRPSIALVLASHGYPAHPRPGDLIEGLEASDLLHATDLAVFHAGTRQSGSSVVTAGGRVLTLCALGGDVSEARARAYKLAEQVTFPGRQLRGDIGAADL